MTLRLHINNINQATLVTRSPSLAMEPEQAAIQKALDAITEIASEAHYERSLDDDGLTPTPKKTYSFRTNVGNKQTHLTLDFYHPENVIKLIVTVNKKTYRISSSASKAQICAQARSILPYLDGDSWEVRDFNSPTANDDAFWDRTWKNSPAGEAYRGIVYPRVAAYSHLLLKGNNQRVLEICAGDGELAGIIMDDLSSRIAEYHLAEWNKASIETATTRMKNQIETGQVVIHRANIVDADYSDLTGGKEMDLVIGCGALNHLVVHCRECALTSLRKLTAVLKVGGALVLTGKSSSYIVKADLEKDYSVRNLSLAYTRYLFPFYVAIKKGPPAVDMQEMQAV